MGEGKTKKLAKRNSAQKILKALQGEKAGDLPSQKLNSLCSDLEGLTIDMDTSNVAGDPEVFRKTFQNLNSPAVQELNRACLYTPEMHCKLRGLLVLVAEENNLQLIECPLEERSATGQFMFLLEITTIPVSVSTGRGETMEQAETDAIAGALEYLKQIYKS